MNASQHLRVLGLVAWVAALAPWVAHGKSPSSLVSQLERAAEPFFSPSQPGGVVLVRKGNEVLLRKAYGLSDVENHVAMKPDSVLRLASVTKQFTAVAVLQCVEAGKLTLDQPLGETYPEAQGALARVTVRQLLTHTSGVKNISRIPESRTARRKDATLDELLAFFKDLPLEFEPGTRFSYSNSNYILLTKLIERASQQPYAEYMRRALFAPLGMNHTRYGSHLEVIPGRAQGYQKQGEQLMNADFISMTQPRGAGGLVSTVDDLNRWDLALYSDTLVSPRLLAEVFKPVSLADGSTQPYGFGWFTGEVQGVPSFEHNGFINGFNAYTLRAPEQRVYVAVLTNAEFLDPSHLAVELAAIALGKPYKKTSSQKLDVARWLGAYDFGQGVMREIQVREGRLYSQRVGNDPSELTQGQDGRYYFSEGFNHVTFSERADGKRVMTMHDRIAGDSVGVRTP
ncbi:beta-lactamase [Myxococcus stipitatus DSM 14675]|uniref:Beta-lactamase n=1 Tax=Myxococcus stipitatus (strain DSM 14675 / JCM 12634 / Mx s8) TaxID=1278073 RepID=L7UP29_MYXSD|nr:serine hydrolase domain-containing protein [Myxococcus stipitatus]AGC48264.1 beta-lactamase [Myxococcus stipitatus DSM 14675]